MGDIYRGSIGVLLAPDFGGFRVEGLEFRACGDPRTMRWKLSQTSKIF